MTAVCVRLSRVQTAANASKNGTRSAATATSPLSPDPPVMMVCGHILFKFTQCRPLIV